MAYPVHHVPGRLRLRNPQIKGRPAEAARYAARIEALPGVHAACANALTGSVVVHYDAQVTAPAFLLAALDVRAPFPVEASSDAAHAVFSSLGKTLARSLLQRLIERSAAAVIGALV